MFETDFAITWRVQCKKPYRPKDHVILRERLLSDDTNFVRDIDLVKFSNRILLYSFSINEKNKICVRNACDFWLIVDVDASIPLIHVEKN